MRVLEYSFLENDILVYCYCCVYLRFVKIYRITINIRNRFVHNAYAPQNICTCIIRYIGTRVILFISPGRGIVDKFRVTFKCAAVTFMFRKKKKIIVDRTKTRSLLTYVYVNIVNPPRTQYRWRTIASSGLVLFHCRRIVFARHFCSAIYLKRKPRKYAASPCYLSLWRFRRALDIAYTSVIFTGR